MESSRPPADTRVDAAWIASRLSDPSVRIVEVDVSPAAYGSGHIPGAVFWNAYTSLRHADYRPVSAAELQDLVRRSGLTRDMTVVFYGYGAHLGAWLLRSHGHERVYLMDGSRDQWISAGQEWSTDMPAPEMTQYALPAQDAFFASDLDVRGTIAANDAVVLDTRSKAEYDGERFWPSGGMQQGGRAGHIPRAVHIPIEMLRNADGTFMSTDTMRGLLTDRGIGPDADVVTYCTIGNRASMAWFALHDLLGYRNIRVYYGSWAEWGTLPDSPVET